MTTATLNPAEMTKFITESVGTLATKYQFNAEEAMASLDLDRMFDEAPHDESKGEQGEEEQEEDN